MEGSMWSDNETTLDLLGFKVHADLIRSVVTDPKLLPITIGIFGDWGGGKTSVMKMLQYNLAPDNFPEGSPATTKLEKTVCLYLNGWLFEGYDDAKSALLSSVLFQLAEHKRFGPRIKEQAASLLASVDWMRLARFGFREIAFPTVLAYLTGGTSVLPALAGIAKSVLAVAKDDGGENEVKESKPDTGLSGILKPGKTTTGPMDVRTFRDRFSKMLRDTNIESLIVLIDDLDRCSPERIVDNLEAIKLFLSVEHTAFVIGADLRIVRHAISSIYNPEKIQAEGEDIGSQTDIITDYIEKVIQVPYRLPRLSPAEVETYMAMLFCRQSLDEVTFNSLHQTLEEFRKRNRYSVFGYGAIKAKLGSLSPELTASLSFCAKVAPLVTEGLKGNPRQVKRFLNAFILRKKLGEVAQISDIKDDILVKLMVLEYAHLAQFNQLYKWQATQDGKPKEIQQLEKILGTADGTTGKEEDVKKIHIDWATPFLSKWVAMAPYLSEVDLRDYFWLARDRLQSTMSDVSMIPPFVRRVLEDLLSNNPGKNRQGITAIQSFGADETALLISHLTGYVQRHPSEKSGFSALCILVDADISGSKDALIEVLQSSPPDQLNPSLGVDLLTLLKAKPDLVERFTPVLDHLRTTQTRIGAALKVKPGKEDGRDGNFKKLSGAH